MLLTLVFSIFFIMMGFATDRLNIKTYFALGLIITTVLLIYMTIVFYV